MSEEMELPEKENTANESQNSDYIYGTSLSEQSHTESVEEVITTSMSVDEILSEMEKIINLSYATAHHRKFYQFKELAQQKIQEELDLQKSEFLNAGNQEEDFHANHALQSKYTSLISIFKEKQDKFQKETDKEQKENFEKRTQIIEKLKNLYTNTEPGTNLFKAIREIKEEWGSAGMVPKSEFKNLNNNYFHHLNGFYMMLDLNKEYREQEYAHNLEKRRSIIARAKELEKEEVVQKALNELQYLHKLWKEEAEPVAEEFRDSTWDEFKEISNKIHDRKSELFADIENAQQENLTKKNEIIEKIKKLTTPEKEANHNYWQQTIRQVEDLRSDFLKIGSVPKKLSNQNWADFKEILKAFNAKKNEFYKGMKNSQQDNLDAKLKLIKTAQDNMNSEEWEITVPLFKKLQEDWKNIGHVPRSHTNKVWDDFREACNTFFKNFREKNAAEVDDWKENFKNKSALLEELKAITEGEGSQEKIEQIKNSWNAIGKVPRDKMAINSEFNKILREKLKINRINEFELKEEGLSGAQLTDKARKVKNQIADLESEISQLENNLAFFANASKDNPLLKDTYAKIDEKKEQLESMKQSLHTMITGE